MSPTALSSRPAPARGAVRIALSAVAHRLVVLVGALLVTLLTGCSDTGPAPGGDPRDVMRTISIGIVAKSQSNPVFQAAHAGARAAMREWNLAHASDGVAVNVDIQTPADEDAMAQAAAVEQLARAGADAIAVACSDANTLRPAIDKAVELGAVVICFDSDSPDSQRSYYFGTDDFECGRQVMGALADALGGEGVVAVLAGNQAAPNLRRRVEGVLAGIDAHPGITLLDDGVFYHPETPEQAAEAVARAQSIHPQITGWAFVGGWPLFAHNALRWDPGSIKVVSVDALPAQLGYLSSGHVATLLAQDCYAWGHKAVTDLADAVHAGRGEGEAMGGATVMGGEEFRFVPLTRVTADNVDAYRKNWDVWLK